jgi:hypothetical protein
MKKYCHKCGSSDIEQRYNSTVHSPDYYHCFNCNVNSLGLVGFIKSINIKLFKRTQIRRNEPPRVIDCGRAACTSRFDWISENECKQCRNYEKCWSIEINYREHLKSFIQYCECEDMTTLKARIKMIGFKKDLRTFTHR